MDGVTDAMTRGIRSTATQRDEGFTLVEVVVAASILFFVLTAVLGLVMATNQMTVLAKERASVTNLISSRLDWIRSQPFTWVAQTNLASETTTTADGFTVTLTYTVTDKSHVNGTKEVRVVASATKPGHPPINTSAFVAIRNVAGGVTLGGLGGEAPSVTFEDPSPPQDSVLFGNTVYGGGVIDIRGHASASSGRSIARIEMVVDGQGGPVFLRDGNTPFSSEAFRDFTGGNISEAYDFRWNTAQVDTGGNPTVQDGYRTVRISATDDTGQQGSKQRRYLVDNYPPNPPGPPTQTILASGYSLTDAITWGMAYDGTDAAAKYEAQLVRDTTGAGSLAGWVTVGTYAPTPSTSTSLSAGVAPFSRYIVRVRAGSPRATSGGTQSWSGWTESAEAKITPPFLQGTYHITETVSKGKSTFTFHSVLAIPWIPAWVEPSTATYELWRAQGTGPMVYVANVTSWAGGTYFDPAPIQGPLGSGVAPLPYTYQLRVTVTPAGYKAAGPETVLSNKATTGVTATTGANLIPSW
jgi:type II secretory pathway pseudopilin PulG